MTAIIEPAKAVTQVGCLLFTNSLQEDKAEWQLKSTQPIYRNSPFPKIHLALIKLTQFKEILVTCSS